MHGSSNEAGPPLSGATLDGAGLADPAPVTDYRVRPATAADADAICRIYNQGIEDRVATLETELRTPEERRRWLANRSPRHPVVVAEPTEPRFVGGHGGGETEPGRTFVKPPTEGSGPADPWRQGGGETGPGRTFVRPPTEGSGPADPWRQGGGETGPGRTFVRPPTEGSGPSDPWRQGGGETGPGRTFVRPPTESSGLAAPATIVGWGSLNVFNSREAYRFVADFSIYVERAWRGRGAGRAMLEALMELARTHGFHKLVLSAFPFNAGGGRSTRSWASAPSASTESKACSTASGWTRSSWRSCSNRAGAQQ